MNLDPIASEALSLITAGGALLAALFLVASAACPFLLP
jgi:hypothetical protein